MSRLSAFLAFLWDFVIGDDPWIAAGVVLAIAITAVAAGTGAAAWWIMPPLIVVVLAASLWRAARP